LGFSVTAAHVVLVVALLGAASAASSAYWATSERMDEARRVQAALQESVAQTNLTLAGAPTWYAGNATYFALVTNTGATVLRVSELDFLVDGAYTDAVGTLSVDGDAATDLWMPGETLEVRLTPLAGEPNYFSIVAGNGASAYHRR
jgi:archaellum component FlaF (FlaF/FlaG flagellin family)